MSVSLVAFRWNLFVWLYARCSGKCQGYSVWGLFKIIVTIKRKTNKISYSRRSHTMCLKQGARAKPSTESGVKTSIHLIHLEILSRYCEKIHHSLQKPCKQNLLNLVTWCSTLVASSHLLPDRQAAQESSPRSSFSFSFPVYAMQSRVTDYTSLNQAHFPVIYWVCALR